MSGGHIAIEKPKVTRLSDYVGNPVIIEPLEKVEKNGNWKTDAWRATVWTDKGNGFEAEEMIIFAKAIRQGLEQAYREHGWLGGVVANVGSQLWLDSSNSLIMKALEEVWQAMSTSKAS